MNPNPQDAVRPAEQPVEPVRHDDPKWFYLTAFQYALIALVTIIFVWKIVSGLEGNLSQLRDLDTARGLITFVITLGTVAIAVMLALTAVVVRDFDRRIVVGREVLTVLVGVLGTIVGFYFGAATTKQTGPGAAAGAQQISVAAPQITNSNGNATLTGKIENGTAPYQYSVKFPNTAIGQVDQTSPDGSIKADFKLPDPVPAELTVTIEGKDKNGAAFAFNKDGAIKTKVQPK